MLWGAYSNIPHKERLYSLFLDPVYKCRFYRNYVGIACFFESSRTAVWLAIAVATNNRAGSEV